jgi:hypothetical protein
MADHSRRRRKCPPNAPHEALRPAPSSSLDWRRPPEQADTIFKGLSGCMALIHTPMLRRCIIAGTNERFEGRTPPQHPQQYPLARGIVAHQSGVSERSAMPRVGLHAAVGGHGCDGDS